MPEKVTPSRFEFVARAESDRGNATEDRCLILPRPHGGVLLVVADGVGGRAGGGEAAQLAVDLVCDHQYGVRSEPTHWSGLLAYIDGEIADDPNAGETTLVLVDVGPTEICGASVGDSQALIIATREPRVGELTQYQQRKPFLGTGAARPMSFSCDMPEGGATILAASDGLFGYVKERAIVATARRHSDLDEAARELIDAARGLHSRTLYDDVAVVLCRVTAI